jgi:hypothetical protein
MPDDQKPRRPDNPKARLDIDDQVTAEFDDGTTITITRTTQYFRVCVLDTWGRPKRDARNFPGSTHHQEREARDWATYLCHQLYSEGPLRWIVYRAATNQRHISVHGTTPQTRPKQLQLI